MAIVRGGVQIWTLHLKFVTVWLVYSVIFVFSSYLFDVCLCICSYVPFPMQISGCYEHDPYTNFETHHTPKISSQNFMPFETHWATGFKGTLMQIWKSPSSSYLFDVCLCICSYVPFIKVFMCQWKLLCSSVKRTEISVLMYKDKNLACSDTENGRKLYILTLSYGC